LQIKLPKFGINKMKIAVVSTGRNRCTLLAKYLHATHPDLEFCGEFYNSGRDEDGNPTEPGELGIEEQSRCDRNLVELTDELFAKENFVVKIIAISLTYDEHQDPAVYRLEEYDQIHFIERHDFFEQCCSWDVSLRAGAFHLKADDQPGSVERKKKFDELKQRTFKLLPSRIFRSVEAVDLYLKIKRYVTDNNLPYTLHTYESAKEFGKKQNELVDTKLNYSELISNYKLKEDVNAAFNKYISYDDMTIDLPSFKAAIGDIAGIRSIQSFANKMAAKWSK
jgi:hypothetical protein